MTFYQSAPKLGNQFDDDPLLPELVTRMFADRGDEVARELRDLGELSGGHFYRLQLADRDNEPVLTQWDPWGHRIDHIEVSPLWRQAEPLAAERGLVAAAYEGTYGGALDRVRQFALNYVIGPSLDVYTCPLAMTDGAARTLLDAGNQAIADRAVPRLTSRDPAVMWTSGQWMTERTGGSDVGTSETVARHDGDGPWRLYGTKWFTSATTSQMALTLGRPEGNGPGGKGLALFYVEMRDDDGNLRDIRINRLKDKLGTRKVPTAELTLDGTPAELVAGTDGGVRNIAPMLNITRTWNAVIAAAGMRRAVALARDYARRRHAFGAPLSEKPLHVDTLAAMEAETEAATLLAFRAVELLGLRESGRAGERDERLVRIVTPLAKLTTGKQAVAVASEALECFGGAGYVEDTGLPRLLADAQVLPIWEGTTNVLSLDTLRALAAEGTFDALRDDVAAALDAATDASLAAPVAAGRAALTRAAEWVAAAMADRDEVEAGARRFALTLGRTAALAYLCRHAQWCLDGDRGRRAAAAARRFATQGVDLIASHTRDDASLLTI